MLINLTPHPIVLPTGTIPPEPTPARCFEITAPMGDFDGVPLVRKSYGAVANLPDPQPGVLYIVSLMVRQALPERTDLASPGDLIRDETGRIVGAANLAV